MCTAENLEEVLAAIAGSEERIRHDVHKLALVVTTALQAKLNADVGCDDPTDSGQTFAYQEMQESDASRKPMRRIDLDAPPSANIDIEDPAGDPARQLSVAEDTSSHISQNSPAFVVQTAPSVVQRPKTSFMALLGSPYFHANSLPALSSTRMASPTDTPLLTSASAPLIGAARSKTPHASTALATTAEGSRSRAGSVVSDTTPSNFRVALEHSNTVMSTAANMAAIGNPTAKFWQAWPGSVLLHSDFMESGEDGDDNLRNVARKAASRVVSFNTLSERRAQDKNSKKKACFHMIRPDSERRLMYDGLSLVVLIFDLIYTPYYLTWEDAVPGNMALFFLLCSATFWLMDLMLSFCTGCYSQEGLVELRFSRVAIRYLKTWFIPDFLCVAADVANVLPIIIYGNQSSAQALSRFIRMIKLIRFLRVLGIVRMLRVIHAVNVYMEAQLSESWQMMVRILQISACVVWLVHLTACSWYAVGFGAPKGEIGFSWLDTPIGFEFDDRTTVREMRPRYQYATSYQWGLAQLTLGSHDISPVNISERIFTTICNLFGLLFGGTLISILSTTLIDLKEINQERVSKMKTLREFLLQHAVDMSVRLRVISQVRDRVQQRDRVLVESDVKVLQVLSHALLRELHHCLYAPQLLKHTLFRAWNCVDEDIVRHLCDAQGLTFKFLLHDDELFSGGETSCAGYHIISGCLEYKLQAHLLTGGNIIGDNRPAHDTASAGSHGSHGSAGPDMGPALVSQGSWLCEATWWCLWCHVGDATARAHSTLLSVQPKAVVSAMSQNLTIHAITVEYARLFHQNVVQSWEKYFKLPTDLNVHYSQLSDLIFSMSEHVHVILGMASLRQALDSQRQFKLDQLARMEQEIREGRAIVLLDNAGSLQRQVALTLLRVEREEIGAVLAEVAVFDDDSARWKPCCRLPGTKQKHGETPLDTLHRCLESDLATSGRWLQGGGHCSVSSAIEVTASAHLGIGTTYNKSIFTVAAHEEIYADLARSAHTLEYRSMAQQRAQDQSVKSFHQNGGRAQQEKEIQQMLSFHNLEEVSEVYVLGTSQRLGMYAWLDEHTMRALAQNNTILAQWVEAVSRSVNC